MAKKLSPEERLLLATIRGDEAGNLGVDWIKFLNLSREARLSPFIYYRWKMTGSGSGCPPEILAVFEKDFYENFSRNTLIRIFMEDLFKWLGGKVKIIPLKGVVFMEKLYPHPGIRPLSDIDLLIREEDYGKLERILNANRGKLLTRMPYAAVFGFSGLLKINLDVSWNLLAVERFIKTCNWSDEEVWAGVERKEMYGNEVYLLPPEYTLLHLIYHQSFQHCFRNFLGYLDITGLINQGRIDWDFFISRIIELGLLGVATKELAFCKNYLGAKVPEELFLTKGAKLWNQIVFSGFRELAPRNLNLSCPGLVDWMRQPFFWDRFSQVGKTFFHSFFPSQKWLKTKSFHRRGGDFLGAVFKRLR